MPETLSNWLNQAAQRGEIRDDLDLEAAARVVNVMVIGVGDSQLLPYLNEYLRVSDDQVDARRVIDSMIDMVLRALSPMAETSHA